VQNNRDVIQSAIVLINGIADRVKAAQSDPGALQALADELSSQDADLARAVAANTPAQSAPAPSGGATGATGSDQGATGATGPAQGPNTTGVPAP
jgi:hypothetical protein